MKKKGLLAALLCICFLVIAGSVYIFISIWYQGVFPAFVWIDDIYCTGKTVGEVNEILLEKHPYAGIKVVDISGAELFISSDEIGLEMSYESDLVRIMQLRGGFNWYKFINHKKNIEVYPTISFSDDELCYRLSNWEAFPDYSDLHAEIIKSDSGYELVDNYNDFPVIDNIVSNVHSSIMHLDDEIILGDEPKEYHSYKNYSDVSANMPLEQTQIVELYQKVDSLQKCDLSYDFFGEEIVVNPEDVCDFILTSSELSEAISEEKDKSGSGKGLFIAGGVEKELSEDDSFFDENGFVLDDDGNLILSESKMYDYANALSEKYTTAWCMNRYRSGQSDKIYIGNGKKGDGSIINKDALFNSIKDYFLNAASGLDTDILVDSITEYNASEKLGSTYIEVDMHKQELTYYVDGNLEMEMPVVTGNVNRGRSTPAGIFDVYNKRYHTYLRGVDYVSYVNYWLGVNKGVGIHDANWRSEFGNEIYKTDGSHGCINCPIDKVSKLWEVAEVGTPVILHY